MAALTADRIRDYLNTRAAIRSALREWEIEGETLAEIEQAILRHVIRGEPVEPTKTLPLPA